MSLIYSILVALNLIAPNASAADAQAAYNANPGAVQTVLAGNPSSNTPIVDTDENN
jgi:hypothetical protein